MAAATPPDGGHTVLSVLKGAAGWLQARGVEAPRRSAELLLGHVLGLERLQLYLQHDRPLSADDRDRLRGLVARRGRGEPVAYLLGEWSFRGLDLAVGPAVLVPRPETEELVGLALDALPAATAGTAGLRVLDLGTGSGAIAVALACARPDLAVTATDVSAPALAVAAANAARHGVEDRLILQEGSWWAPLRDAPPFDLVVSNPPYVDPARPELLDPAVAAHEPGLALFAEAGDPLSSYRAILMGLERGLRPGGVLLVEAGVDTAAPAADLLARAPFLADVALLADLQGVARFVRARRVPSAPA